MIYYYFIHFHDKLRGSFFKINSERNSNVNDILNFNQLLNNEQNIIIRLEDLRLLFLNNFFDNWFRLTNFTSATKFSNLHMIHKLHSIRFI